jgi:hypothetical protein
MVSPEGIAMMVTWLANLIAALACIVIAGRLLLFRRGSRRHRRVWSVLAWILINASLALALHLALGIVTKAAGSWPLALLLTVAACQVIRVRGNAAKLMRIRP